MGNSRFYKWLKSLKKVLFLHRRETLYYRDGYKIKITDKTIEFNERADKEFPLPLSIEQ